MKVRVLDVQADQFEVGVLSQTAEVQAVSLDELMAVPAGPPIVVMGGLLSAERLPMLRRLAATVARAKAVVVVVPPFNDLDLGRYFETPAQLRAQRHSTDAGVRIVEGSSAEVLGDQIKIRSDHHLETALGAGVVAVDQHGKPLLVRFQVTNTSGPVFFSALQLLTYTALTDEGQRQATLTHILTWSPCLKVETDAKPAPNCGEARVESERRDILVPVALLLASGGQQAYELLCSRGRAFLGVELSANQVDQAIKDLKERGVLRDSADGWVIVADRLQGFLEHLGLDAYVRELRNLIATEDIRA